MALVRGINTAEDDHGKGAYIMHTGRRPEPAHASIRTSARSCAKLLGSEDNPLPGYIHITPGGNGGVNAQDAAFLGPALCLASPSATASRRPTCCRPDDADRRPTIASATTCGSTLNERFLQTRRTAETEAYTHSYDQAAQVMQQREPVRHQPGAARSCATATARTTSAGTACWPAGCSRAAPPSSR